MIKRFLLAGIYFFCMAASTMNDNEDSQSKSSAYQLKNIAQCKKYWQKQIDSHTQLLAHYEERVKLASNKYELNEAIKEQKYSIERLNAALTYCYTNSLKESKEIRWIQKH